MKINDNISIEYRDINMNYLLDSTSLINNSYTNIADSLKPREKSITICGKKFNVIGISELVRSYNEKDGYYRVIYIQINMSTGEYYIGKANRPSWSALKRYEGSGLKFKSKFKKNKDDFVKYYIAICNTAEETEKLEASIVNKKLLEDDKCLNLVVGGAGTTKHISKEEKSKKQRKYMLNHPEQYKSMVEKAKELFRTGKTHALKERSEKIKKTMSSVEYREKFRERLLKWKNNNPEAYIEARAKNKKALHTEQYKIKQKQSHEKWKKDHPKEYALWQEKRKKACSSKEAILKRKQSLENWYKNNKEQAQLNVQKRAKIAAMANSKPVGMIDLKTGKILKVFSSGRVAAKWLVESGKAKNMNATTSISAICLHKVTPGHGCRKKAYGYGWCFVKK